MISFIFKRFGYSHNYRFSITFRSPIVVRSIPNREALGFKKEYIKWSIGIENTNTFAETGEPTFKDLQEDLINKYKKGTLMNESINNIMAEANETDVTEAEVKKEVRPGQETKYVQTEDQVGTESKETRIN